MELTKEQALAKFLDDDDSDIVTNPYDDIYELGGGEYLVLTDEEATEKAIEYIKESVWAFSSWFLAGYCDIPESIFEAIQPQCESANDAILALIEKVGSIEDFAEEAISADGRGHFLASYDGHENEQGGYFIYRVN